MVVHNNINYNHDGNDEKRKKKRNLISTLNYCEHKSHLKYKSSGIFCILFSLD